VAKSSLFCECVNMWMHKKVIPEFDGIDPAETAMLTLGFSAELLNK